MTTTVNRSALVSALRAVRPIAGNNPSLPILNNVSIESRDGTLVLVTTNLDVYAERLVSFEGDELPKITVSAKGFADFAGGFSGDDIKLAVDGTKLRLTSGRNKATLAITDAADFPAFTKPSVRDAFTITREELDTIVARVAGFAATDTARPILTGIQVHGNGERIRFAAADNYRVGVLTLDHQLTLDIVVPAASLIAAQKVLGGSWVNLTTDGRVLMLESESGTVLTRLIEGQYPNIEPILPTDFNATLLLSEDEFTQAAKLASLANATVAKFEETDEGLHVSASDYDREFDTHLDATIGLRKEETTEIRFSLNTKYVIAVAAVFAGSTTVEVGYGSPLAPVAFRDPDDASFRAVVMPVRTSS